jgi:hypothetical protein
MVCLLLQDPCSIVVVVVQLDGKNLGSGKVVHASLCAADPVVDCQGAMGRMWVAPLDNRQGAPTSP